MKNVYIVQFSIPDDAKPESFKVGNDATFLQIVGHHTTARAAIQK